MEVMSLKSFIGGIHPKDQKQYTKDLPIIKIKASDEVVFPLKQHIGAPCQPIVKIKDNVKVGQIIATSDQFVSSPIISSVSGVVKKIEERMDVSGKMQESIVIANDGLYQKVENNNNKQELTYEEKIERIKAAGIVGLGGAGFPTHIKLSVKDSNQVQYYIVNGAECEPYLTSDYRLMLEKTDELIAGIHVLLEMFPKALCYIAIEDNKKEAIHLLKEKCKYEKRIAVKELKTKYPQGGERMLVKVLTGKTLNSKMLPLDVGCIVDNVATVIAINQAVRYNQPLISKVMTISGDGITPSNIEVPIGTSFKWIVEQLGGFKSEVQKLICGGPMMGSALIHLDIPVTKTSSSLLALVQDEVSLFEPSACIRCGRCKDVCPSLLVPQKLYQIATKNDTEAFILNGGMECIECGCCSYTCPAKRNMTQAFKKMKYLVSINKRK